MRGYFAIGIEGVTKQMNLGNLFRTAHGFGAQFVFTINKVYEPKNSKSDTSAVEKNIPLYHYDSVDQMDLPKGCQLVGIELVDEAVELPSFRHPRMAAYILGGERLGMSEELVARCDHIIKIPTKFCLNVATAGAIIMYDRMISLGKYAERPVKSGGPTEELPSHSHGKPILRKLQNKGRS